MNWKEFFKPAWSKLIVLLIIIAWVNRISYLFLHPAIIDIIFNPFSIIFNLLKIAITSYPLPNWIVLTYNALIDSIQIALAFIWTYAISCLIVYIYKKFKK